jgi:hypothetical protein
VPKAKTATQTATKTATKTKSPAKAKTATPWGTAELVEELTLPQRAGAKHFASVLQLLEMEGGERLVRVSYSTGTAKRRGPVTLRASDIARLRNRLADHPGLAEALGLR